MNQTLSGLFFIAIAALQLHSMVAPSTTIAVSQTPDPSIPPAKLADVLYAKINPRVVKIEVKEGRKQELGSGAIAEGNLVTTCFHVVRSGGDITVRMSDKQTTYAASVLAKDEQRDLAVLKVANAPALPAITLAGGANIGDKVFAFGSPLGLQGAMTEGKILELANSRGDIMMDALIEPGIPGGPLINKQGEAVGTNCGVLSRYPSKGIAKPINQVKALFGGAS